MGSVFSPYYCWTGRTDPENHVALNVALYQTSGGRWSMTERGRDALARDRTTLAIGPSRLAWDDSGLSIHIREIGAPLPRPIRGTVRIRPNALQGRTFDLDDAARHQWRPIAPGARIEVEMSEPGLSWQGHGYFDHNRGGEPLEAGFARWDWSRSDTPAGTLIQYDPTARQGAHRLMSLLIRPDGGVDEREPPPRVSLPPTLWRVERATRATPEMTPRLTRNLEDAPFYARAMLATRMDGKEVLGVHESLSGDRLKAGWVWPFLPFRMPRAF